MRFILTFILLQFYIFVHTQSLPLNLSRCYGGSGNEDRCFSAIELQTGYLLTGKTNSYDGDVSDFHGGEDGWLVKIDTLGNIAWTHAYGNGNYECLFSTIQTKDGNLLSVGYSSSIGGHVTSNAGDRDYWVIKTDMLGNIIWQKSYGGSKNDIAYNAIELQDSSYLIGGMSHSLDGDITDHHGNVTYSDAWLIRVDPDNGTIIWKRSYGGDGNEGSTTNPGMHKPLHLIVGSDTTFAFTCLTSSADGDVQTNPTASTSYWLVKAANSGSIIFENSYGGTGSDISRNLALTNDGGFIVVGGSTSNNGDITNHHGAFGTYDEWVVKTDSNGNIQWQNSIGGTDYDEALSVAVVPYGYYVLGRSESSDYDCSNAGFHGSYDYFLSLLDTNGLLVGKRCFGGNSFEEGFTVLHTLNNNIICAGHAGSNNGDVIMQHGGFDFWIVGYKDTSLIISPTQTLVDSVHSYGIWPNPGNGTLYVYPGSEFHYGEIIIYDMRGRLVMKDTINTTPAIINVEALSSAVYRVILTDEHGTLYYYSWVKY